MNRLSLKTRCQIVSAMVEGCGVNSITRLTGVAKNTVLKLLLDVGTAAYRFHDRNVRNVRVRRLQADEIWSFIGAKKKNVSPEKEAEGWGDIWTWVAIDADTKLIVSYYVGDRGKYSVYNFMRDAAERIVGRPQLTTDAHRPYLQAVEDCFGVDVDYAMLQKLFGASSEPEHRYSPATCIGCDMKTVMGDPDPKHVSTSFVERQNLTMRMSMRRFTRLTNAHSKKLENHCCAVSMFYAYYNFCRVHQTLRVTPAMEAKLTDHVWSLEELLLALENSN